MGELSEKREKKPKLRGFVGVIWKQLEPLNNIDFFKKKYQEEKFKILLNATDGKLAAIIIVEKGMLSVESVKNGDKKYMKQVYKENNCNGKLYTTMPLFLDIAMGKLGLGAIVKKIIGRKIKIKGIKNLLKLLDMFNILDHESKKKAAAASSKPPQS